MKRIAKSILKKIREAHKRFRTRHLAGNFRRRKYWSDNAKNFMDNRQLFSFIDNGDETLASTFVRDVREYYSHYGAYDLQAVNVALSLLRDVYSPDVLPVKVCKKIFTDKETAALMSAELFGLLCEYGSMDIVYRENTRRLKVKNSCRLNNRLFLTRDHIGMPVRMFLIWTKGGEKVPSEILKEWSGVPRSRVTEVYNELIDELRYAVIENHSWEWQIEETPRIETVCYF